MGIGLFRADVCIPSGTFIVKAKTPRWALSCRFWKVVLSCWQLTCSTNLEDLVQVRSCLHVDGRVGGQNGANRGHCQHGQNCRSYAKGFRLALWVSGTVSTVSYIICTKQTCSVLLPGPFISFTKEPLFSFLWKLFALLHFSSFIEFL